MKFTIGTIYSRVSQLIAQDFSRLLGILVLSYSLPIFAVTYLTTLMGDNGVGIISNIAEFFATTLNLCLVAFLIEARQSDKPFKLSNDISKVRGLFLPLFVVSLITGLLIFLGTILLIVPGIIAAVGLCVAAPAYIYEKRTGVSEAIKRSWKLTQDYRIIIGCIYLPLIAGIGLIFFVIFSLPETFNMPLLIAAVSMVSGSISTFFLNIFSIMIYITLREVKEGHAPDVTAAVFD